MPYTVGQSGVANWANTTLSTVTGVVANGGLGGSGEVVVGGSDRVTRTVNIDLDMQYPTINVSAITGYIAGKTDVIITVGTGVYVYGYSFTTFNGGINPATPFSATMNILGGTTGDTIKLVNNGYILGAGGDGGGAYNGVAFSCCCTYSYQWFLTYSTPGQAALEITYPLILENNGYIAGGGGGGAFAQEGDLYYFSTMGGGGGAGGGLGIDTIGVAAVRAVPPNVGNNGAVHFGYYGGCGFCGPSYFISGGGGGFVLPGVGGLAQTGTSSIGRGGGSGGAGSAYDRLGTSRTFNNNGGTANGAAPSYTKFTNAMQSGGGGGWGARGGDGYSGSNIVTDGEPGGNSIITNGNAITTITAGTQYGAIKTTETTYVRTLSSSNTLTTVTIPAGYTNAIIFIPTGVTLRTNLTVQPALYITGTQIENLKIIVNGAILGMGGTGGSESNNPSAGGTGILLSNFIYSSTFTVDCTNGYVAGGGGGGGYASYLPDYFYGLYGGGGAGGGNSGSSPLYNRALGATTVGTSGSNGTTVELDFCGNLEYYVSGGGGGLIVPGASVSLGVKNTIDSFPGIGGSGGGSGAARKSGVNSVTFANNGGGFNQGGGTQGSSLSQASGGGGGGWGGNGGTSKRINITLQAGAAGGVAIDTQIGLPVYIINPNNVAGLIL
jgi:hypothetical protein